MSIARRLYLLLFFTSLILISLSGFQLAQMRNVYNITNYANVNTVPSLVELSTSFRMAARIRAQAWQYLASDDSPQNEALLTSMQSAHDKLLKSLDRYEKNDIADEKDAALLKAVRANYSQMHDVTMNALALAKEGKRDEAKKLIADNQALQTRMSDSFDAHRDYNVLVGKNAAGEAENTISNSTWISAVVSLLSVGIIIVTGILLVRKIAASLNYAATIAQTVASGDLTATIEPGVQDEAGKVLLALKNMNGYLLNIVTQVRHATDSIASASTEIATGNLDLSARTEEQASALEETASSMEELTSTVRQNADNARQADHLARTAHQVATRGGRSSDHHECHPRFRRPHRRYHQRHRRHRLPDQYPRAQCRGGSRPRRRARPRFCRGGGRSAQPGAAQRLGGEGNQTTDQRFRQPGRTRHQPGESGR